MAKIIDLLQDPLSSLNRICSLGTQQEGQILHSQQIDYNSLNRKTVIG